MKIEHKPTSIQTSKQFTELEFGIKQADMGLVLEILRSKMYKNPIGAICREVASNSRDANREAENNVPIEISINDSCLTSSDLTIVFKDAGPGISPERMADVFVNYGSSTKRDTNEYTGGFGLGAKTPFSYTDNFSIETVFNGIKYSYVAAIEEGRKGKIYLIDSQETQNQSGTSIIVPIKSQDRQIFEKEVYKATVFWSMKPIYKNFKQKLENITLDTIYDDDNFLLVQQDLLDSGYGLLLDGIYYPIDRSILGFASQTIYNHQIIFKFNVGDLTISANRETLQYDDKTKTAINKRFVELINLCKDKYLSEFKKNTTWLDAALFKNESKKNLFYLILKQHETASDPWFKVISVFDNVDLNSRLDSVFGALNFYKCDIDPISNKITKVRTSDVGQYLKSPMFLFDENQTNIALKDAAIFKNNTTQYIAIKVSEPKFYKWSELKYKERKSIVKVMRTALKNIKDLSNLGFTYNRYSDVEKLKVSKDPKVKSSIPGVQDQLKVYVRNVSKDEGEERIGRHKYRKIKTGYYSHIVFKSTGQMLDGSTIDPSKICVQLVDDLWQEPQITDEIQMLRFAMKLNLIDEFKIIYANKKRGKELTDIFVTYDEKLKLLTPDVITKIIDGSHIHEILNNSEWLVKINFKSKTFSTLVKTLSSMLGQSTKVYVSDHLKNKYAHLSKMSTFEKEFLKLKSSFPLLLTLSEYEIKDKIKDVTYYINLVESDLINKGLLQ